jgi:nucleoid-associated protein YgaU
MTIYLGSRYATQQVHAATDTKGVVRQVVLRRVTPLLDSTASLPTYIWRDGDRIDSVALDLLGAGNKWHTIMDVNPEISDPASLQPGDVLRYPRD